jgi:hypothetical protein
MNDIISVGGYEFVAPLGDLIRPYSDYFATLGVTVDEWERLDEAGKKELIRVRDMNECQIGGGPCDVHEAFTRGSQGRKALAPWAMICLSRKYHDLAHGGKLVIETFDPLDYDTGLVVILNDRIMQKSKLMFYAKPNNGISTLAHKSRLLLEEWVKASRHNAWTAARELAWLKKNAAHGTLGEDSHESMLAGIGLDVSAASALRRVYEHAELAGVTALAVNMSPARAATIIRKAPKDKLREALTEAASYTTKRDFESYVRDLAGARAAKTKRYFAVQEDGSFAMIPAESIAAVPGKIVVDGAVKRDVDGVVKDAG